MNLGRCLTAALLALLCWGALAGEASQRNISAGDADIPTAVYPAPGASLILWFPSEYGVLASEHVAAHRLADEGLETWLPDLYGARFLPVVPSSAESLAADDVYRVIAAATQEGKRKVYLLTAGRGAKYVLEGARLWRQRMGAAQPLAGAILLYPNLYQKQPEPGEDPIYLPIAGETALAIDILQGELSPWYWTLDSLNAQLARGGSQVSIETFPGIRDRFYFREQATAAERALGERLPELIARVIARGATPHRSQP
jgi:hypothetical protein